MPGRGGEHRVPGGRTGLVRIASRLGFGVLLLLLGGVWMGQGLSFIPGSFMTGEMRWFWIGLGCAVVGLGLVGLGIRARRPAG